MSGAYSSRSSYIGTSGKPDPGTSRLRDESLAQILPRTATPTQPSSMSRNVISAPLTESEASQFPEGSGKLPSLFTPRGEPLKAPAQDFRRLSITGKLSASASASPAERTNERKEQERIVDRFTSGNSLSAKKEHDGTNDFSFDLSKSYHSGETKATTTTTPSYKLEGIKSTYSLPAIEAKPDLLYRSGHVENAQHSGLNAGLPEMMKNFIDSSISNHVQELQTNLQNAIQNLHIDLIKQTLGQQTVLKQIVASLPEAYNRLAEENRKLREENERLRLQLD